MSVQMLTALVLLCSIGTTDYRNIAEAPDQTELPFRRLAKIASDPIAYQRYQEHYRAVRKAREEGNQL